MTYIDRPTPNYDSREGQEIDMLVLHYTGMPTAQDALQRLCDPESKVSAHYLVDEDGSVYTLVAEKDRAWHAGVSSWRKQTNINHRSIGVEIVNPGHEFGYRHFPKAQMQALSILCGGVVGRYSIPSRNVVGHSDIAPERKEDPGELFNWKLLAALGVGLWPDDESGAASGGKLATFGYDLTNPEKTIMAFQRRFRPAKITGQWDAQCAGLLASLLTMI